MRRYLQFAAVGLAVLLALLGVVVVALFAGLGRESVGRLALWGAERSTGFTFQCDAFSGDVFNAFSCRGLSVADAEGVFLSVAELEIDWQFLPILSRRLTVERLRVVDAALTRSPDGGGTDQGFSLPDWPGISILVDEFVFANVNLQLPGAPAACLSANGHLEIARPNLVFDAQAGRCEAVGQIDAHLRYGDGRLEVEAQAVDDGALASNLLGWEGAGATEIQIAGSGPLTSFAGTLDARIENGGAASLRIGALALAQGDEPRLSVEGEVMLAPSRLPTWAPASEGAFSMGLGFPTAGGTRVEDGSLRWNDSELRFMLAFDGEGNALSGDLNLSLGALTGPLAFQSAQFSAAIQGSLERPVAAGFYALTQICVEDQCSAGVGGTYRVEHTPLAADFSVEGMAQIPRVSDLLISALGESAAFELSGEYLYDGGELAARGSVQGAQMRMTLTSELGLQDGVSGSGNVQLTIDEGAVIGDSAILGGSTMDVAVSAFSARDGVSGTLNLASPVLDVAGRFAFGSGTGFDVDVATTRIDPERLSQATGVEFIAAPALELAVTGAPQSPTVTLDAVGLDVSLGGFAFTEARWNLQLRRVRDAWEGDAAWHAQSSAGTWALNAALSQMGDQGLLLDLHDSTLAEAQLAGTLAIGGGAAPVTGTLNFSDQVLSPLATYWQRPITGEGTIVLNLEARDQAQTATVAVALNAVSFDSSLTAAEIAGQGSYNFADQFAEAQLTLREDDNEIALALDARLTPETVLSVNSFEGRWAGTEMRLLEPVRIEQRPEAFVISPARLSLAGGEAELEVAQNAQGLSARIALTAIPVAPLSALVDFGEGEGWIDGTATVRLSPTATRGDLAFAVRDLAFGPEGEDAIPADISLTGDWDGLRLSLRGEIAGLGEVPGRFDAALPLVREQQSYSVRLEREAPISGHFDATARVENFVGLLPLAEHRLTGALSTSLTMAGTLSAPQIVGEAILADGSYESLEFGTRLQGLRLAVETGADGAFSIDGSANDGNGGQVSINGRLTLGANGRPVGRARLGIADAYLLRRDQSVARGSGLLTFDFSDTEPTRIEGSATTSEVRVDLGQSLPPRVEEINVVEIDRPPELGVPVGNDRRQSEYLQTTVLDLAIAMPNNIQVSGLGINSEWSGNLHIGGTVAESELTGRLNIIRGTAEFLGREFILDEGQVTPVPNADGGARLRIVGSRVQDGLTVRVTVEGTASSPQIAWSSTPALPREEIISRLYFGRVSGQLSAYEAIQLAELTGALGTFGGTGGMVDFARRVTSLDVLRLESPAAGGGVTPNVTVGKYVTDRIYVGATRDAGTSSSAVEVEVAVTPNIKVDVEAGSTDTAAGVNWHWDY